MNRWLTVLGLSLTAAYLAFLCFVFNGRVVEILLLEPNEIGDVLAGSFGPLAILWLILGFFQQGYELRQNTEALKLQSSSLDAQVSELINSVEQQRQLVDIARKQFENEIDTLRYEREKESRHAKPDFIFSLLSHSTGSTGICCRFRLTNVGNTSSNISFQFSEGIIDFSPRNLPLMDRNSEQEVALSLDEHIGLGGLAWIKISFKDALGSLGQKSFVFARTKAGNFDHFLSSSDDLTV